MLCLPLFNFGPNVPQSNSCDPLVYIVQIIFIRRKIRNIPDLHLRVRLRPPEAVVDHVLVKRNLLIQLFAIHVTCGRELLQFVVKLARDFAAVRILLEVRPSNTAGRGLYADAGFSEIAKRRGYYPAHDGREDAIVLELELESK